MKLRIVCLLLAGLLLSGLARAMDPPPVPGQDADYQAVSDLQKRSGFNANPLPKAGAQRSEMVLALAETAAHAAGGDISSSQWKSQDYNALYSLLQKYRDEIRALGVKDNALEDELAALRVKQKELEEKLKTLALPKDGMKIGGSVVTQIDDLQTSGPGSPYKSGSDKGSPIASTGQAARYRTAKTNVDLRFTATHGPLTGMAEWSQDLYFGYDFPPAHFFGLKRLQAEARLPVSVQAGDISMKMTPFTLWRNEDLFQDEPEPFASRRQSLLDDYYLEPDKVSLRGIRLASDLVFFDTQVIHTQALIHFIGFPTNVIYYMGGADATLNPNDYPNYNNALMTGPYSAYTGAWQADWEGFSFLELGYQGTLTADYSSGGIVNYSGAGQPPAPTPSLSGKPILGYSSQVHSVQASAKFGSFKVSGEYAESLYSNPNYFTASGADPNTDFLTGTAMSMAVDYKADWFSLGGNFRNVDSTFISSPAQGRTHDTSYSYYGPFPQANSHFNPEFGSYFTTFSSLLGPIPDPNEDHFADRYLPPEMMYSPKSTKANRFAFNYLMPYNAAINASTPYGLATPNRQGFQVHGAVSLWNKALSPWAMADMSGQKVAPGGSTQAAESYTLYGAGSVVDLAPWLGWPLSFSATMQLESISNGGWVKFNSTTTSYGVTYKAMEKLKVFGGMEHMDYSGTLAYPLYGDYTDPISGSMVNNTLIAASPSYAYDQAYDTWALGLRLEVSDISDIQVQYSHQTFWDNKVAGSQYELDQAFAKFEIFY